jgi:glyoxylase-like metal-dependent hydrolase (beta-lactamase superfamily II)
MAESKPTDTGASGEPPLRIHLIPVTAFQQNCSLVWCTKTMRGALVDPGGDLDKLKAEVARRGVTLEKLLVTHGHMDHCGLAGVLAQDLGLPIEGPHEGDRFWIEGLDNMRMGLAGKSFEPDRWLVDGDTVTVGELGFRSCIAPAIRRGMWCFSTRPRGWPLWAMFCFRAASGAPTFPRATISN